MPVVRPLGMARPVDAAAYNRLRKAAIQDPTPATPERGMVQFNAGALEVYYGATTGWAPPWNVAWGEKFSVVRASDVVGLGTTYTDITTLTSGALTYLANRIICVRANVTLRQITAAGLVQAGIHNGTSVAKEAWASRPAGEYITLPLEYEFVSVAGSLTVKVQARTSNNTVDVIGAPVNWLVIHDAGPGGPAPTS